MALIFEHPLLHDGEPLTEPIKYILRSDLMYERVSGSSFSNLKPVELPLSKVEKLYIESQSKEAFSFPLTNEQLNHMDQYGYVVFKNFMSKAFCNKMISELSDLLKSIGIDMSDPSTHSKITSDTFPSYHLPTQYEFRTNPKLYSIFAQLLKTHRLTTSIDRIGLQPPVKDEKTSESLIQGNLKRTLHHDLNLFHLPPNHRMYQAGLAILDCPELGGGFKCIPKFHNQIEKYHKDCHDGKFGEFQIPPENRRFNIFLDTKLAREKGRQIAMEQGDLIVWDSRLPHNGAINTMNQWRIQAFARMVAMDGPCTYPEEQYLNTQYRDCVKIAASSGESPTLYSTHNRVMEDTSYILHEPHQIHKGILKNPLSRKLLGFEDWAS